MTVTSPVFGKRVTGKRGMSPFAAARPQAAASAPPDADGADATLLPAAYASFFRIAQSQLASEHADAPATVVPRSMRAAILSGLVVGCLLAGFDAGGGATLAVIARAAAMLNLPFDRSLVLPGLILLGLIGGARLTAITVVAVHSLLARFGQTGFPAYAAAGAAASLALAALVAVSVGHAPDHGWVVEALAGAASGFFYRVFAGTRPAN